MDLHEIFNNLFFKSKFNAETNPFKYQSQVVITDDKALLLITQSNSLQEQAQKLTQELDTTYLKLELIRREVAQRLKEAYPEFRSTDQKMS